MPWQPLPLSYAIAIYPFQPSSSAAELPLQIGDQLYVIEEGGKDGAWCRGYLVAPPSLLSALSPGGRTAADARVFSGIFPKCCIEIREELGDESSARPVASPGGVKPPAPVPMLKIGDESPSSSSEPLVDEISSCLREWYISHLPDLVLRRKYDVLDKMSAITTRLDYARRELLNDVLTTKERKAVQSEAVWDLVRGNKMLGAETIVRDPKQQGRLLTGEDSAIDMAKLQSVMSVLDEPPTEKSQATHLNHCLLEVKHVEGSELDAASLIFALYQKDQTGSLKQFSETCTSIASAKLRTLLTDLSSRDIVGDAELYLMIKVAVSEQPKPVPKILQERPPSRNGTLKGTKGSLLDRRRTSMFGSKRKTDKPVVGVNGRGGQVRDRAITPGIPEEPEDATPTQKPNLNPVPRMIATGLLEIGELIRNGKVNTQEMELWSPASAEDELNGEASQPSWHALHGTHRSYTKCKRISKVKVELKSFQSSDPDDLIRMNPTSMHQITKTPKIGFSEAPTKTRSDIYLTLSKANIFQGSQLSHPEFGSVAIRAAALPNLQLTMELRDKSGKRLEHCIFASSNGNGVTALRTHAIELGQEWDQTICIRLPLHKVSETHLVLSVADAPEFPFALAWMPLWNKQTFLRDGKHSLILHAYDKTTSTFSQNGQGAYLALPWDHDTFSGGHDGVTTHIASLEVETRLCSTEFSQDRVLAGLFNWKTLASPKLMDMLLKLFFVPEIEIVKQLDEVLDSLFAILEHKAGSSKFEDTVFNNLVFVLGIVHDRRYNLGPLVERYAEDHFQAPFVAPSLVRSWTRLLQSVGDPQSSRDMRSLFKVGKQFMKLLMASYSQQKQIGSGGSNDQKHLSLKEDLQAVLFGLQMLMRSETPALVGSKTLLVQNFHSWLPELLTAFSTDEVVKVAINFIDSCDEVTGKLALYKLVLIQNYTKIDQLWIDPKDWKTLVRHCLRWLEPHWNQRNDLTDDWREQVRLCCSVVAELSRRPIPQLRDCLTTIINSYCTLATDPLTKKWTLSLLFSQQYPFITKNIETDERFDESLLELSSLLSTVSAIEPSGSRKSAQPQMANILNNLTMVRSLLKQYACPSSWLSLNTHYHYSSVNILGTIAKQLTVFYLPEPEQAEKFEMELWKSFFDTLFLLVSSPSLTLEAFSEQKRRAVWKIAGDVRQAGADLLRASWSALGWEATADDQRRYDVQRLGGFQVQYVPSLVGPVIELCLSMHEGLRRVAVEILQAMIISEWGLNEDLDLIETEVVGALNRLLKANDITVSNGGNEVIARKLFVGELLDLFGTIANQPDDALWTALEELVATIEELIDLLTAGEDQAEEAEVLSNGNRGGKESAEVPDRSISRLEGKIYGTQALELYKQLADEYERTGDFRRLARTHRAIARIHEARAASRLADHDDVLHEDDMEEEEGR